MAIVCSVLLFISLFLLSISFQYFIVTMAATGFLLGGKKDTAIVHRDA